jgi:mannan endo-1,4-beta-mannosidase
MSSRSRTVAAIIAVFITTCMTTSTYHPIKEHDLYIGIYQPNSPGSYNQLATFAALAGFTPRITSYYTNDFAMPFALSFAREAASEGTTVLVQWQPRNTTNAAVASGAEDGVIIAAAQAIASLNYQVILSYGQEMNGDWYSWGNVAPNTAAAYIAAYRHIWEIFQQQGVHNVTWLWDPNIIYEGSQALQTWYPGDQYVDWVGLDGYFGQPTDTFSSVFSPSIAELRTFTYKPLLIAETGVSGATGAAQLDSVFAGASLAGAVGIVYFDETQTGDAMHQDWRLENNAANMLAFKAGIQTYAIRPLIPTIR